MRTLGTFLKKNARKYNEKTAYEIKRGFRIEKLSFRDVNIFSLKTAALLKNCRLKKGDTVAIWAPNMPEYPVLYFACWLTGVVAVPIDIRTTEKTLNMFVAKAKCKIGFKGKFIPGNFPKTVAKTFFLEDLLETVKDLPKLQDFPDILPEDLAEIAFTSGTTGVPKGVILTHENFLSNVESLCNTFPLKKVYRTLSLLPLSHAFEQVVDFLALFQTGITAVYLEKINRLTIIKALKKQKITSVAVVPQLLQLLMSGIEQEVEKSNKTKQWKFLNSIAPILPLRGRRLIFSQVRKILGKKLLFFGCGSAPLNIKLARKWENLGIEVFEGYGATETTAVLTINTPFAKRLGSVGKVLPNVSVNIESKTREIIAKGPNISRGYFKDSEKTKQAFSNGYYKTGDIGKFDKNGYLYITGREAFRIVLPDGRKVYPEDIEKKLDAHPLVIQSCVVGIKREEGEKVHAVLITKFPKNLDEIIRQVNKKLSSHEQILEWSQWKKDDFPRTPILKIDRRKVSDLVSDIKEKKELVKVFTKDKLLSFIEQITQIPAAKIKETHSLATDLKLDSLQRVELLSLIEQELAVAVPEMAITQHTTVSQLRKLIKKAEIIPQEIHINSLNYTSFVMNLRAMAHNILVFPLHSLFAPIVLEGREKFSEIKPPAIFYFNHMGVMDALCVLRVLPVSIRKKLVIAATVDLWKEWRKPFVELWGGSFPFDNRQNIKAAFELTGEFLDKDFSIMLAPEGAISPDGELMEFKSGIGFMAVNMHVPVIPVKIDPSYREIFPPMAGSFLENIPKKRKKIWVKIGKPLIFSKQTPIDKATMIMRKAMLAL